MQVEVVHTSLKNTPVNTTFKGYYGGKYLNKWGNESITLYNKNSDGSLTCITLPFAADLKKKIPPSTAYVELTFKGLTSNGRFNYNNFDVICSPLPANNPRAAEFMDVLHVHTRSLAEPGLNRAAPVPPPNWPSLSSPSSPAASGADPFEALKQVTTEPKPAPEFPF